MAVYTDINETELETFLKGYGIGALMSYKGIAEGVENSNFLLHTERGYFILTLYEKRVNPADLPFFLGLMDYLSARGITCPRPVPMRSGEMLGSSRSKAALVRLRFTSTGTVAPRSGRSRFGFLTRITRRVGCPSAPGTSTMKSQTWRM